MNIDDFVRSEIEEISSNLGDKLKNLDGSVLLLTGGAGFLGFYLLHLILHVNKTVLKKPCKVICVDSFIRGIPSWMETIKDNSNLEIVEADITKIDLSKFGIVDYVIHAASIASPTYYRQFPIETMDANVIGLRNILDYCVNEKKAGRGIKSFLFFSSSEIYGDPTPDAIPTPEEYRGFVSCTGPRACYDESKRFGETLCVNFHSIHGIPIKIARPFNNYGPGLGINDRRVIPDFSRSILNKTDIVMLSDGSPMRTFCYITDAITGYMLLLFSNHNGESFNIGTEKPEIPMKALAELIASLADTHLQIHGIKVVTRISDDKDYLVDNPSRRCPSIKKASDMLGYCPKIALEEGLLRTLLWYKAEAGL